MKRKQNDVSTEKLQEDLKNLVRDAEALLSAGSEELAGKGKEARAQLETALESAKESCQRLEAKALEQAKATDKVIREHPYEAAGFGFCAGLLLGVLLTRR